MRILHLLASPVFSGPAEPIAVLASAQRALGHEVTVAVDRSGRAIRSEEPAGPRFAALRLLDETPGLELSVKSSPLQLVRDVAALRSHPAEVLHAHFSHDHHLAALASRSGVTVVRSIHAPRSFGWATPKAKAFTVATQALVARVERRRVPVLRLPAMWLPPAQRLEQASARGALGLPTQAPLIGLVSSFQPSRRLPLALEAFALLRRTRPEARLVLAGDGELEQALRERAEAADLRGSVHFLGYRSGDAFFQVLAALDEVWVLGLGNDFSGRAAAQARAFGVRVLAVDEGALGSLSDVVVLPEPQAIAHAALGPERREVALATPESVAQAVLALYAEATR